MGVRFLVLFASTASLIRSAANGEVSKIPFILFLADFVKVT